MPGGAVVHPANPRKDEAEQKRKRKKVHTRGTRG